MSSSAPGAEGKVPFRGWETWYKVFGDLKSAKHPPLITVHGGPCAGSETLEVLAPLYESAGIPVVVYDQVGCGRSTTLPNEPQSTFTIDLYLKELQNLIDHLEIKVYDLLGHSWGGMLSLEHAMLQPKGLRKLILDGTPASMELTSKVQHDLYRSIGERYYQAALKYDEDGTVSEDFQEGMRIFMTTFLCRLQPFPDCMASGLKNMSEASNVMAALWGTEQVLRYKGLMKTWTSIDRLHLISNEALVITSEYDYCGGAALNPFLDGSLKARLVKFPNMGHMTHVEAGKEYISTVAEFLNK